MRENKIGVKGTESRESSGRRAGGERPRVAHASLVGQGAPRPALLAFTAVRKYTDTDWDAKGIGLRTSWDGGRSCDEVGISSDV